MRGPATIAKRLRREDPRGCLGSARNSSLRRMQRQSRQRHTHSSRLKNRALCLRASTKPGKQSGLRLLRFSILGPWHHKKQKVARDAWDIRAPRPGFRLRSSFLFLHVATSSQFAFSLLRSLYIYPCVPGHNEKNVVLYSVRMSVALIQVPHLGGYFIHVSIIALYLHRGF